MPGHKAHTPTAFVTDLLIQTYREINIVPIPYKTWDNLQKIPQESEKWRSAAHRTSSSSS